MTWHHYKRVASFIAGTVAILVLLVVLWLFSSAENHLTHTTTTASRSVVFNPMHPPSGLGSASTRPQRHGAPKQRRPGPKCATATIMDAGGAIWIASEGEGVFRFEPATGSWTNYTTANGLSENVCYGIARDQQGRIWVGHATCGLSIFDGVKWINYDTTEIPLGERVFGIAVSPLDGDVWIASSMGLTRYLAQSDSWRLYTRASGLPLPYPSSLTFASDGTLFVGTDSDGIIIAYAAGDYAHWITVPYPQSPPKSEAGQGLPCGYINCLCADHAGNVYAGTKYGLAETSDAGASWRYVRGIPPRTIGPKRWDPTLLLDDYVTTLAVDGEGQLCVGRRHNGWEIFDVISRHRVEAAHGRAATAYVTAIVPMGGSVLFGTNGAGVTVPDSPTADHSPTASVSRSTSATLPSKAPPPSAERLRSLVKQLDEVPRRAPSIPTVVALDDDWRTQGNWIGRYGRYWACLAAMAYPEYVWNPGPQQVEYTTAIGINHRPGDSIRHYVAMLYTDDRRCLELPSIYYDSRVRHAMIDPEKHLTRRESVWDDHGEAYASSVDGPDLVFTMAVPKGMFILSLYDANQGGEVGVDRFKDYVVLVRPSDEQAATQPEISPHRGVRARIWNFVSGVYKRFFVTGPAKYQITIRRTGSYNTVLAALMLDTLEEEPSPYFIRPAMDASNKEERLNEAYPPSLIEARSASADQLADAVFVRLEQLREANPTWWVVSSRSIYWELMRYYSDSDAEAGRSSMTSPSPRLSRLATCYMNLGLYDRCEACRRQCGLATIRGIEKALRWDGVTDSYRGKAYQTIRAAVERGAHDVAAHATN